MSSNRSARIKLEKIFGKICMIEELGIRKIPKEERRKIKGYTKYDDQLTFHHIKEKHCGGKATPENGALLKGYNHRWLHTLSDEDKSKVNNALIEFKATVLQVTGKGIQSDQKISIDINFGDETDCISIPVFDMDEEHEKKRKFNRAKQKRENQRIIDEDLDNEEEFWR